MKHILLALLALLTACGGSTAHEPVAEVIVPVAKPAMHVHLYGDSTQAWNPHTGLAEMLPAGSTVQVTAWPGLTAIQHLHGVPSYNVPPYHWSVQNCGCDTVVVNYGINDATKLGVSPDEFRGWITSMRSIAESEGKKFVWQTPNPIMHPAAALLESYASVADGRVAGVYSAFIQYGNWHALMSDGLHPNSEGYAMATRVLARSLTQE